MTSKTRSEDRYSIEVRGPNGTTVRGEIGVGLRPGDDPVDLLAHTTPATARASLARLLDVNTEAGQPGGPMVHYRNEEPATKEILVQNPDDPVNITALIERFYDARPDDARKLIGDGLVWIDDERITPMDTVEARLLHGLVLRVGAYPAYHLRVVVDGDDETPEVTLDTLTHEEYEEEVRPWAAMGDTLAPDEYRQNVEHMTERILTGHDDDGNDQPRHIRLAE
jgi:hypothetical protein